MIALITLIVQLLLLVIEVVLAMCYSRSTDSKIKDRLFDWIMVICVIVCSLTPIVLYYAEASL